MPFRFALAVLFFAPLASAQGRPAILPGGGALPPDLSAWSTGWSVAALPDLPRPTLDAPAPNPFTSTTVLAFALGAPGPVRLEVFDALGRRMAVVLDEGRAAGRHEVRLDGARLRPGLYLARITANGQTATRRLVRAN